MSHSYLDEATENGNEKDIWSKDFEGTWLLLSIPGIMIAATIVVALFASVVKSCRKK